VGPPGERPRRAPAAPLALDESFEATGGLVARVVAVTPDLLLGSKVEAMLAAAGHDVTLAPMLTEAPLDEADLLVADLDAETPEAFAGIDIPILGYYSHVNAETKEAAEAAGIDLTAPRSRMARELPQLAERLLEGGAG